VKTLVTTEIHSLLLWKIWHLQRNYRMVFQHFPAYDYYTEMANYKKRN